MSQDASDFFLTEVRALKLRCLANGNRLPTGRVYEGILTSQPRVGERMVMFRRGGDQMVTSPVRRILVDSSGKSAYVETQNSVYRICLGERASEAQKIQPRRVRIADDGSELTFVGDEEEEAASEWDLRETTNSK
jgi:hypothetical protein